MRQRPLYIAILLLFLTVMALPASAQLVSNKDARVRIASYYLNVSDIDAQKKFWVDTLGGKPLKLGRDKVDVVEFPDVFIFLHLQKPTGVMRGTAFDHIGMAAPKVPAVVAKLKAAGLYNPTIGREPVPGAPPPKEGEGGTGANIAYILGPDGVKIEIVTNKDPDAPPLKGHHIHFINKDYLGMCDWYMKVFDAPCGRTKTDFFIGGDLPGVGYSLNFFRWEGDRSMNPVPTKGRVVDRAGFEVKDLKNFCKELRAKGIRLTTPYRKMKGMDNIGVATITDPWGVTIQLTEGLDKIQ